MGKKQANKIKSLFASKIWKAKPVRTNDDYFSVRGFLQGKFSTADLLKAPSKETREEFKPFLLPVTITQVGRVSGYVAMAHVVASSLGTVSMAAQQVIVSLFYCLCPIADSLSLTAQSFVPAIAEKKPSLERAAAMKKTAINFLKAGGVFGVAMVAAVSAIPLLSGFFTADPAVVALVNSVTPLLLIFFAVHGIMCASEGLLLGQKDLGFLGKMYAGYFVAVPYLMLRVKKAALTGSHPVYLTSVWKVFIGYQLFRSVVWLARAAQLQRRIESEASRLPELAS
jgi:Na+-driven multidrug efflux pump